MRRIVLGTLLVIAWARVATPQALTGEKVEAGRIPQPTSTLFVFALPEK